MKTSYQRFVVIMFVVLMLSLISCITAFSQTDYRTDIVLTIEETTYSPEETTQEISSVYDIDTAPESIAYLNKDTSYIQTGNIIWWLPLVALVSICAAILIVRTIKLKK